MIFSLQVHVQYPEKLPELHNNLPFLAERIKIKPLYIGLSISHISKTVMYERMFV